jgi:hypothetical protein
MKKFLLISCCLLSFNANAQQTEYTVKLTAQELDLIGEGLGTQPFKVVAPLLQKMREQIAAQQQVKEEKKDESK